MTGHVDSLAMLIGSIFLYIKGGALDSKAVMGSFWILESNF